MKKEERSKEELDALKEVILCISRVIAYCKDKNLPEVVADQIMMETAVKWYETDFNVTVEDPYACKELPAYHEHVKNFVTDFSSYLNKARAVMKMSEADDNIPSFEFDPNNVEIKEN